MKTPLQLVTDFFEVALLSLWAAWNTFLSRVIGWFNPWTFIMHVLSGRSAIYATELADIFDTFLADLAAIVPQSIARIALENLPAPPKYAWKVLTLADARRVLLEVLLVDGVDAITLRSPAGLRIAHYLDSQAGLFRVLLNHGFVRYVTARLLRILKFSVFRIVLLVIRVLIILFAALGGLVLMMILMKFFELEAEGQSPLWRKALQQKTPRKWVKSSDGPIHRREVGGSKP